MEKAPGIKVVILCGGRGTRLVEETEYRPKPMVRIGDKPILVHIMEIYSAFGFKDFILALGFKGEMIKDYFLNYDVYTNDVTVDLGKGKAVVSHTSLHHNWRVTLARTGPETLTGGRIAKIRSYLGGGTFMATYGDGVSDLDISRLIAFHREKGKIATVTGVRPMTRFGELKVKDGLAVGFEEKPQIGAGLINGGFFVFEPGVFDYIKGNVSLEREPLEKLARDGQLAVYEHSGFWHCMDTYRDMENLEAIWKTGRAPWQK